MVYSTCALLKTERQTEKAQCIRSRLCWKRGRQPASGEAEDDPTNSVELERLLRGCYSYCEPVHHANQSSRHLSEGCQTALIQGQPRSCTCGLVRLGFMDFREFALASRADHTLVCPSCTAKDREARSRVAITAEDASVDVARAEGQLNDCFLSRVCTGDYLAKGRVRVHMDASAAIKCKNETHLAGPEAVNPYERSYSSKHQ